MSTTMAQTIINRMKQLDEWRWDGMISEAEYQTKIAYWRKVLYADKRSTP